MPKYISAALLDPALSREPTCTVVAHEDKIDRLLAELATFRIDLILSDTPLGAQACRCAPTTISWASPASPSSARKPWPPNILKASLNPSKGVFGLPPHPPATTALRRSLDQFFDTRNLHPHILGERRGSRPPPDPFGSAGRALFPASALVEEDIQKQNNIKVVGHIDGVRERFYAISPERKLKHPAVVNICLAARKDFFR